MKNTLEQTWNEHESVKITTYKMVVDGVEYLVRENNFNWKLDFYVNSEESDYYDGVPDEGNRVKNPKLKKLLKHIFEERNTYYA